MLLQRPQLITFRVVFLVLNVHCRNYRLSMKCTTFLCCVWLALQTADCTLLTEGVNPKILAKRVADRIIDFQHVFLVWDYGGAVIFDGLYHANKAFNLNYSSVIDTYLDWFENNPASFGYRIMHEKIIPVGDTVGDILGLFPITYLNRATSRQTPGAERMYNITIGSPDWDIIIRVVNGYVLRWPRRLRDGTFSRDTGWGDEPIGKASFVWADDQYMGLVLIARLGAVTKRQDLIVFAANMLLHFRSHLQDPADGLSYHGYNAAGSHTSCCKWGRANGWGLMAQVEVLQAMTELPTLSRSDLFANLLRVFTAQTRAMARHQSPDGRLHQVINDSATYLETSATAMFVTSLTIAITRGWLPLREFEDVIERAWRGLCSVVREDGTVDGICMGTGIQSSVAGYQARPTAYLLSGDGGLGTVIAAAIGMHHYNGYRAGITGQPPEEQSVH